MSTDRDVNRIVRSWLEEGVTALPDRVLDNVLDRLPATHQRRSWWPARRLHEMNTPLRIALAAAAVLVVALLGITLLPRVGGVAAPVATPTPTPAVLPTGSLTAGTYVTTPFAGSGVCMSPPQSGCTEPAADNARASSIRLTLTVPDGWRAPEQGNIWLEGKDFTDPSGAGLVFLRGAWLLTDPCQNGQNPDIPVGPTVDDFANALAVHPILDTTAPVDVTLGGYSGKYLDLRVPADISRCAAYRPWEPGGAYAQGPSNRFHLWILDVNGVRIVIQALDFAATSAQHQAELRAIVNSIQIRP